MKRTTSLHIGFFWPLVFVKSTNYIALPQKIVWDPFRIARHFAIFHKLKNVFNSNRDHDQLSLVDTHTLTEMLFYIARKETACALLPFCCQKQIFLPFPLWLPDHSRGLKGGGLKITRRNQILLNWICFTRPTPWRVRSQLVRHCELCFRKEERFFLKHYCHWGGVIDLPQSCIGALPSQKHPGCKNLTRRCNDLLKVFARVPSLSHSHSHICPWMVFPRRECRKEVNVLPCCVGDTHQAVTGRIQILGTAVALQELSTFPLLGDNITPDSK